MASFPPAVVAMAKEKAEELEEFQEPAGETLTQEEEPEAKRRLTDKQVGESLILNFLERAKSLPATMSEAEVKKELRKMKQEMAAKNNKYITDILSRCGKTV
nr:PREDICTED: DNA mismatch repair protein Msh2-like [Paralichthys olivaceus]